MKQISYTIFITNKLFKIASSDKVVRYVSCTCALQSVHSDCDLSVKSLAESVVKKKD